MMSRIATLRAEHVMTPDVIVLRDSDPIPQAVSTLKSHHISGAPVVDENGKLVGLLSISDIVGEGEPPPEGVRQERLVHRVDSTVWKLFDRAQSREPADTRAVRDCMTTGFTSVGRKTSLINVARTMCTGHWHRVPVVDDDGALCGMITTLDILAALVNAADESIQKAKP
jgi:CBS-domain-containing membrane protein